ncbi:hypothetical protein Patl1_29396 [Pistacia atlantica]|uniref:Uncharacterized protein n=1 Tax=Pistacia atlantica TaxID=434234 RepID=A0ACC1A6W2_9ROSI|nr:hypothetical protein Patl1_29396 [Pistacia atlantica]
MKAMPMDAFRVSLSSAVSSSSQGSGHDDGDALGDVFIWGEGIGDGVLGGGPNRVGSCFAGKMDSLLPKALESAVVLDVQNIACGGRHAALVTKQGEIFSWGEESGGRLGHGVDCDVLHPKLVDSLSNMNIELVACGEYHTCAVTLSGDLYTWGDGTYNYGLLGHGNEGIQVQATAPQGKLFTWGDGDKGRLGHGDKEAKLVPTCVAALVEPNFCQVACGHSLTVALTTAGHVYTMGSPVYGQLGNPHADGKLPTRVEGKLFKSFVEEIACGAYHVAVLTSKTEVYTWGKGANGRLGHGDTDDRNSPSLVEALKDKQVKSIACGTNFTAAICLHKWVSGVDQSISKKSLRASMAPNPNKPYRVCDNCFNKLRKAIETDASSQSSVSRRGSINQGPNEFIDKDEKLDSRSRAQLARFSSMESFKQAESRSKRNKKLEFNSSRVSPVPNGSSQWGALNISKSFNPMFGSSKKFFSASVPGSRIVSRATSPISRRPSPPRSTTPTPTLGGLTSPKIVVDDAKRTNDSLSQEVIKLRAQVENLTRKAQLQEVELERTTKQLKEAIAIAGEETAKCKAAKEVIKSLTAQLKDMAERLPVGALRNIKSPTFTSFGSSPASNDILNVSLDRLTVQTAFPEPESNGSNNQLLSNGSSTASTRTSGPTKQGHLEAATRNGNRTREGESRNDNEWVEQDEPGVYITLTSLPGGIKDLKRVRFSRKRFSEKQAEQWWAENRARVYERYNVRTIDKSSVGVGSEDLAH